MNFFSRLRDDSAENSIMQTITIAVSAILIAAGLVTAPGLINNARDNNARTDLANIAYGEEFYMATTGEYLGQDPSDTDPVQSIERLQEAVNIDGGVKFTLSGNIVEQSALVCKDTTTGAWAYLIKAKVDSPSGASQRVFFRSSLSATTEWDINNTGFEIPGCMTAADGFADFVQDAAPVSGAPLFFTTPLNVDDSNNPAPYSYYFVAVSPSGPVTYSATGIPAGMTLDAGTGEFSGKAAVGTYNLTVTATNADGSSSVNATFVSGVVPSLTSFPNNLPDTVVGANFSYQFNASGVPAPAFTATGIPAGLVLDSDGLLHGTPTSQVTDAVIEVTASNDLGDSTDSVTLTVGAAYTIPNFSGAFNPTMGQVGVAYSYVVSASGNPNPTFSATGLPAGLSINSSNGNITGTPTTAVNSAAVTVTVTNTTGVATSSSTLTIIPAYSIPSFTAAITLPNGQVGQVYAGNSPFTTVGNPTATYSATGLPNGLTMDSTTGVISGTPTAALNNGTVVIKAENVAGNVTNSVTLTILPIYTIPAFSAAFNPSNGVVGQAYTYNTPTATGTPTPVYNAGALPDGLTIDTATGVISGTPTMVGNFNVTVAASNLAGTATVNHSIQITPALAAPVFSAQNAYSGSVGATITRTFSATGNPAAVLSAGTLPSGLTFTPSTGVLTGQINSDYTGSVVITATNSVGTTTQTLNISVTTPTATWNTDSTNLSPFLNNSRWMATNSDGSVVVVLATSGFQVSTNSGVSYTSVNVAPVNVAWSDVTFVSGTTFVASGGAGNPGYVARSTNNGASWTMVASGAQIPYNSGISDVDVSSNGTKMVGGSGYGYGVFYSADSGTTWSNIKNTDYYARVAISPDGGTIYATTGIAGTPIFVTTDFGGTWTSIGNITGSASDMIASNNKLYLVTNSQVAIYTKSSGTWATSAPGAVGSNYFSISASADDQHIIVSVSNNSYPWISHNGGSSWSSPVGAVQGSWRGVAISNDGSKFYSSRYVNASTFQQVSRGTYG